MVKYLQNVTGEYKTEVREEDPNERPIVGQSKSLSCYNSEENKGNPEAEQTDVQWIHDGQVVRNDDRHEGASARVIKYYSDFTFFVSILNVWQDKFTLTNCISNSVSDCNSFPNVFHWKGTGMGKKYFTEPNLKSHNQNMNLSWNWPV